MGNIRGGTLGFHGTIGQPTAQVIDGSLKFNGVNQHLTKTFSSSDNRRTFTVSYWIKESGKGSSPTNNPHIFAATPSENTRGGIVHRGTGSDANEIYSSIIKNLIQQDVKFGLILYTGIFLGGSI